MKCPTCGRQSVDLADAPELREALRRLTKASRGVAVVVDPFKLARDAADVLAWYDARLSQLEREGQCPK